ncbi:MAG: methyltransferase domain-containing protein [Candidatus Diapherotrites archaeon]|nr:methyltransferase domain-containing protein [Candidatus Diapherotrites archaeon]
MVKLSNTSKWIKEDTGRQFFIILYKVDKVLFKKRTKYQNIVIGENKAFGRMLFLDNEIQIAELDVDIYDKALVDPIFKRRKRIKKAVILGGGDGGVLHELLKHDVEKVYLVDIDKDVVDACKKYLKRIHKNAFNDKRAEIVIQDANEFLKNNKGFDAVIYDLTMFPNLGRVKRERYLSEIFGNIRRAMKANGILTMQMCSALDVKTRAFIERILRKHFKDIRIQRFFIQPYCEYWLFASAKPK